MMGMIGFPPKGEFAGKNVEVLYYPPREGWAHMTLAIGIKSTEGIVLVSDGLVTAQPTDDQEDGVNVIQDRAQKIFRFGPYAMAFAGFWGLAVDLVGLLEERWRRDRWRDIGEAKLLVKSAVVEFLRDHQHDPPQYRPDSSVMIAGYRGDEPQVYCLHSQKGFYPGFYNGVGSYSGLSIAEGLGALLFNGLTTHVVPLDRAKRFGVIAINVARCFDKSIGEPDQMTLIRPGFDAEDISAELPSAIAESHDAVRRIRKAFH